MSRGFPDVNATAAALLGLLRAGPATGYALYARASAELGDFWTVTRSQVYRELAAMAATGLVQAGAAGAREARPYTLTEAGTHAFAGWLHADSGPDTVRIPLLLKLAFADALDPHRLAELVGTDRAVHAARLASYEDSERALREAGTDPGSLELATLAFGLAYERAVLSWCDALPVSRSVQ